MLKELALRFDQLVGKQADADQVRGCLDVLGFHGEVNIPEFETDAYASCEADGISLLFEAAYHINQQHNIRLPSAVPVLTAVFLYGPGGAEFSQYQGDLPSGLRLSDSQTQARAKLGQALKFNEARRLEIWQLQGNVQLFVLYADDLMSIARVQFGVLWT